MKKRTTNLIIATLALVLLCSQSFAAQPIKGKVAYHDDDTNPIPSVTVLLLNEDLSVRAQTVTNFNGMYIFPNVPYGNYFVQAQTTPVEAGGIESTDLEMMEAIIDGLVPTEIEFLAANLIDDDVIDELDIAEWEARWEDGFEPEWVFGAPIPVNHDGTKTNVPTMGGSSSGDVNGTFVPTGRSEIVAQVNYFAKTFSNNFSIEIFANDLVSASSMGMIIDYPSTVNVKDITSQVGEFNNLRIENNKIVITWANKPVVIDQSKPVVTINGMTNKKYNGGDIKFNVNSRSHFASNGEIISPEFKISYLSVTGTDNLSHCYPNPANNQTTVYFNLPADTKAMLNIYSLNGALVKTIVNAEMTAGQHSVVIPVNDLREGVYFYSLTTNGNVNINEAKRLVVVH
jgi:hypothetical protein